MDHLKMHSLNKIDENISKIANLFPNCVTEAKDENGEITHKIDFDMLKQELSHSLVEGREERYQFTWPDKKQAILTANAPINKTLRPCREESVNFDETENLYIEGDNLEVLKLLQETYLGKIKMIYIDPPYNTGNDFVYNDEFSVSSSDFSERSGNFDEEGNLLVDNYTRNTESNGRFHTNWLNMIYPRLKLAKDLLSDDGVIFISIDDNEQSNLKKVCDEIFGAENSIGPIIQNKQNAKNDTINVQKNHEFILVYRKQCLLDNSKVKATLIRQYDSYKDAFEENGRFYYLNDSITTRGEGGTLNARPNLGYTVYYNPNTKDKIGVADYDVSLARESNSEQDIYIDDEELLNKGYVKIRPPRVRGKLGCWTWELKKFNTQKDEIIITGKPNSYAVHKRTFVPKESVFMKDGKLQYLAKMEGNSKSILDYSTNEGSNVLTEVLGASGYFNNPKNLDLLKYLTKISTNSSSLNPNSLIILDFFSGSATTAHAVMQLNAEDGGNRKFIMVQLPEVCDEKSEAFKAGYKNICEIGKERIRRAGQQILKTCQNDKEKSHTDSSLLTQTLFSNEEEKSLDFSNPCDNKKLDIGFRVLKCDSTNMEDVYYTPDHIDTNDLFKNNIKSDRTAEDLLFQVMLDLGIMLSSKIQTKQIDGKNVYCVEGNYLMACFDDSVDEKTITKIAKEKPYYFVMKDSSMANDSVATNFEQIFTTYSPETVRKIL